jgi:protein-tyrosine phosphatase
MIGWSLPNNGVKMMIRIPALVGALNFRDLGGYEAADGRSIRWNLLYRSGSTHALTAEDLMHLDARRVHNAYDLRSNAERHANPSRLTRIANFNYLFRDHNHLPGDIKRLLHASQSTPEDSRRLMISLYTQIPYEFKDAFQSLFKLLIDGKLPLVFNCSAGKDRTGVAAALVLSALGVPRETILEDYLLSDQFFDQSCKMILDARDNPLFRNVRREIWEPIMRVDPRYLTAMFDELDKSYGSPAQYLEVYLALDAHALQRIRSNLLE